LHHDQKDDTYPYLMQLQTELGERIVELDSVLRQIPPVDNELTWRWWQEYTASNRVTLPYGGGLLAQPEWVMNDFAYYDLMVEYVSIEKELNEINQRFRAVHERTKGVD
jgi:hypothetical protein